LPNTRRHRLLNAQSLIVFLRWLEACWVAGNPKKIRVGAEGRRRRRLSTGEP